jgi:pyruvate/2-oxoglutarate dehydrogenase complex dihydrolipoamide acyltransferase (E2) component
MSVQGHGIIGSFDVQSFPVYRMAGIDFVTMGKEKNHVPLFVEIDVTMARKAIRCHKATTGEGVSFTGWIVKCLAQAVSEHKRIHALRKGHRKTVIFDDVDVNMPIERQVTGAPPGETLPVPFVIRKANEKTVEQIHAEIRAAQAYPLAPGEQVIAPDQRLRLPPRALRLFLSLPRFARNALVWNRLKTDPFFVKEMMGTVGITSVGMYGRMGSGGSWVIPFGISPLNVAIGGIARRPAFVDGRVEAREFLSMTLVFDHDIIDGGPVARFVVRLTELMEGAFGLTPGYIENSKIVTARS